MDWRIAVGFAIVLIILIIYYMYNVHGSDYEKYLYGFWVADTAFCDEAGVEKMMIFIGDPVKSGWSTRRNMYLAIKDTTSQLVSLVYSPPGTGFGFSLGKYKINCTAEFEEDCGMSSKLTFEVDMHNGLMRIYGCEGTAKTLYGLLYKDMEISDVMRNRDD